MPRRPTMDDEASFYFEGFVSPNTTAVPDELFDRLLPRLSGAELKALLYIIRRTFGFKRDSDAISFSQFLTGITTKAGRVLDEGCGIKSRSTLSSALITLEEKGIIHAEKRQDVKGDPQVTVYRLRFAEPAVGRVVRKSNHPSPKIEPGGGAETEPGAVRKSNLQQTGIQETDLQQTGEQFENSRFRKAQSPLVGLSTPEASAPAPVDDYADPERQTLGELITDFARLLGDQAPVKSSATRAYRIYRSSGLDLDAFIDALYEARAITQERTASITSEGEDTTYGGRRKTKMGYFFAVLEDRLEGYQRG